MSDRPNRWFRPARTAANFLRRRPKLSRTIGQPRITDLGNGYKAITVTKRDVLRNGKRITPAPATTIVNTEKDRRLAGKKRRLARKAAQRGEA